MRADYDNYLKGMDASMRQKVALTAAHLLTEGELADMGMGSGSGSFALASLYPELTVIGVDLDPEMVRRARERYRLPNLRFVEGDISQPCFEPGTIEAILDSSVLHHVTSFGGYDRGAAARAMAVQAAQLSEGGVLIVRDFVDPRESDDDEVWLDLPHDDGDDSDDPLTCSSAQLFERFAREFRLLHERPGFAYDALPPPDARHRRYRVSATIAAEFVLRKDYRDSWAAEVQEEYTYATQAELEAICAELGLRVLASTPIYNPWIIANRFEGQFRLWRPDGRERDHPPTNFVIVGQKVPRGHGVGFDRGALRRNIHFLELTHHRHLERGVIYDLARRPGPVTDVLPWFERDGRYYVLARRSYPRPILSEIGVVTHVTEPFSVAGPVEEAFAVRRLEYGATIYPSPGGIEEQVRSLLVEIAPEDAPPGASIIEAQQLLRAAQVGGLPDARLELHTYELLLRRQAPLGPWIGEPLPLTQGGPNTPESFDPPQDTPSQGGPNAPKSLAEDTASEGGPNAPKSLAALLARPGRRMFARSEEDGGFLEVRCAGFVEREAGGGAVGEHVREWVVPRRYSHHTVSIALLRRCCGEVLMALDDHDLPAVQAFDGQSAVLVTPAWRVPGEVQGRLATWRWVQQQLREEYGLHAARCGYLGGPYHPSAGLTPELVTPLFTSDTTVVAASRRTLHWVRLRELIAERDKIVDGHTRIASLRVAHALTDISAAG